MRQRPPSGERRNLADHLRERELLAPVPIDAVQTCRSAGQFIRLGKDIEGETGLHVLPGVTSSDSRDRHDGL